jgi:hypothetical protein
MRRGKFTLPIQILRQPSRILLSPPDFQETYDTLNLPPLTAHPAVLAHKLLQLAICLQQLDKTSDISDLHLGGHIRDVANRYFDAASHVTSHDLLVSSPTGLETLMLQGLYQFNLGNLRLGWLIYRRALGIASLMGLHMPQQQVEIHRDASYSAKEYIWFRLIYGDRFLSLTLSNPLSIMDNTFANEHLLATEVPLGKLERMHAVVMSAIISRNHRMCCEGVHSVYKETQDIDYELKRAMRSLPLKWWIIPKLSKTLTDIDTVEETARLLAQINQHYLLVLLHLPYIMQTDTSPTRDHVRSVSPSFNVAYNKLTALNSSRQILSRFMVFRTLSHVPFCCHGADFKAFCASMNLVLAHLNGHLLGRENMFEHQRPQDLAMVDHVIESMERMARFKHDMLSGSSAQILRKLVDIEAEAACGVPYVAWSEDEVSEEAGCVIDLENHYLRLSVPSFGTIRITRQRLEANSKQSSASAEIQQ